MALNVIEMAQLIKLYQERTGITDDMIAGTGGGIGGGGNEVSSSSSVFLFVIYIVFFTLCVHHSCVHTHMSPTR